MKHVWVILAAALLAGCGRAEKALTDVMDAQMGVKKQLVVLAPPSLLPAGTSSWPVRQQLQFLGSNGLCVGLANGVDLRNANPTSPGYLKPLSGKDLQGALILKSGKRVTLQASNPAWARYGHLGGENELSACLWSTEPVNPTDLPVSAEIVNTAGPIKSLGVYWQSETDLSKATPRS